MRLAYFDLHAPKFTLFVHSPLGPPVSSLGVASYAPAPPSRPTSTSPRGCIISTRGDYSGFLPLARPGCPECGGEWEE